MRILVIDDEDMIREIVQTILRESGHEVLTATNGSEGLKILETEKVDLVITDILMPEKEGVETIFDIRFQYPHVRIIAMSGGGRMNNFDPLKIARKAGAHRVLTKPLEQDDLLNAVRDISEAPSGEPKSADSSG